MQKNHGEIEKQVSQDIAIAVDAIGPELRRFGKVVREQREEKRKKEIKEARRSASQHDLNTLATAIREFVWAEMRLAKAEIMEGKDSPEVKKQQEQSSRMETSLREQLEILNMRVMDGQNGGRPHHRMR